MKEDEAQKATAAVRHLLRLTPDQVAYLRSTLPIGARDRWMVDALNIMDDALQALGSP